jgi:hypothetical protein
VYLRDRVLLSQPLLEIEREREKEREDKDRERTKTKREKDRARRREMGVLTQKVHKRVSECGSL